jgi:hypothetical protein
MVYRFMRENRGRYTVREMAAVFGVSCSAYYQRAKKGCHPVVRMRMRNWYV